MLEQARVPVLIAAVGVLVAVAVVVLRRRGRVARVVAEGACPAGLALGLGGGRALRRVAPEPR